MGNHSLSTIHDDGSGGRYSSVSIPLPRLLEHSGEELNVARLE